MARLSISDDLSLPLDTATHTLALLAKKGAGKTYTSAVMIEEMLKARKYPCVTIDPLGVYWGLRSSSDGASEGLPVLIAGGKHGDLPLEESAGAVIADLVIGEQTSAVLDLSALGSKAAENRFMLTFLERLYRRNESPVHLIVDEADMFAPQKPRKDDSGPKLLGLMEDIVRRGRAKGIGITLISQRPAVLNKNVLTQVDCLIVLRLVAPQDQDALLDWVERHAEVSQADAFMKSLAALPTGTAWVWSPEWLEVFQQVKIRQRETFDSSRTPKVGEKYIEPKALAEVDLGAWRDKMAATIERAKADDPRELRKQVADLKKQLSTKTPTAVDDSTIERAVAEVRRGYEKIIADYKRTISLAENEIEGGQKDIEAARLRLLSITGYEHNPPKAGVAQSVEHRFRKPEVARSTRVASSNGNGHLPIGEKKILTALIQYSRDVSRESLTVLTGYKRSSRDAYIQRLREKGYVESDGGMVIATEAGVTALPDVDPLPTGEALRDWHLQRLPIGERVILEELIRAYPKAISRDDLTESTEYKRSSRDAYLQRLAARMLVDRDHGGIKASDELFE